MSNKEEVPKSNKINDKFYEEVRETALIFESYLEEAAKIKFNRIVERAGFTDMQAAIVNLTQNKYLLAKDIIYPSIKKIIEHFPNWYQQNSGEFYKPNRELYQKQMELMIKLCNEYEKSDCDIDDGVKMKKLQKVLDCTQNLLDYGELPHELVNKCVKEVAPDCTIM